MKLVRLVSLVWLVPILCMGQPQNWAPVNLTIVNTSGSTLGIGGVNDGNHAYASPAVNPTLGPGASYGPVALIYANGAYGANWWCPSTSYVEVSTINGSGNGGYDATFSVGSMGGSYTVYLSATGEVSAPASTVSVSCATIVNQAATGQFYGFTDQFGNVLPVDGCGDNAVYVGGGQTYMACIAIGAGTNTSLVTLGVGQTLQMLASSGVSGCDPHDYFMGNSPPITGVVSTNLNQTAVPGGGSAAGVTSTNVVYGSGMFGAGVLYNNTNVDVASNGPIVWSSTNTTAANNGTLMQGFGALYTAQVAAVAAIQKADNAAEVAASKAQSAAAAAQSSLTAIAGSTAAGASSLTSISSDNAGMLSDLNTIAGAVPSLVGNGVAASNSLGTLVLQGAAGTNLLTAVKGDLDTLTNRSGFDSNLDATALAISNNTYQPMLYTNVSYGVTDVVTMTGQAQNIVGTNLDGATGYASQAQSAVTALSGWNPGGVGTGMQVVFPNIFGRGDETLNFDPMSMDGIQDVVAWCRMASRWMIYVALAFGLMAEFNRGMGIVFTVPQGKFPNVQVLGNTVGLAAAPAYVVGLCAVLIGAVLAYMVFFGSFTGDIMTEALINPFSTVGVSASIATGIALLDEFMPLGLAIQALAFYIGVKFLAVRIVTVASIIVRGLLAAIVLAFLPLAFSASAAVKPEMIGETNYYGPTAAANMVPVVVQTCFSAKEISSWPSNANVYLAWLWPDRTWGATPMPIGGSASLIWVPWGVTYVYWVSVIYTNTDGSPVMMSPYSAGVQLSGDGSTNYVAMFWSQFVESGSLSDVGNCSAVSWNIPLGPDEQGPTNSVMVWLYAGMATALALWGFCYAKRLIATQLGHESDRV